MTLNPTLARLAAFAASAAVTLCLVALMAEFGPQQPAAAHALAADHQSLKS